MTDPFLRISVLGTTRNADLVVPLDQSGYALLPQILGLLGEPQGRQETYTLTTRLGEAIDLAAPLGETGLTDGAVLRLARETDTPPVPVVSDLVDATAEHESRGRWLPAARGWVLSALSALSLLLGSLLLLSQRGNQPGEVALAAGMWCLLSLALKPLRRDLAWCYAAAGLVMNSWWAWHQLAAGWSGLLVLLVWLAAALLVVALHTRRRFAYLIGLAILVCLAALWWAVHQLIPDELPAGVVIATFALFALGLAPRLALSIAGVFKADDAVGRGTALALSEVVSRLDQAHAALSVAVGLLALCWTLGMAPLVAGLLASPWTVALGGVLLSGWTLRGRHFPLVSQRIAIYGAALGSFAVAAWAHWHSTWSPAVLGLAGAGLATLVFLRVSEVSAAQLRRVASWLETLAVLATIPLIFGLFGLYTQLLRSFQ